MNTHTGHTQIAVGLVLAAAALIAGCGSSSSTDHPTVAPPTIQTSSPGPVVSPPTTASPEGPASPQAPESPGEPIGAPSAMETPEPETGEEQVEGAPNQTGATEATVNEFEENLGGVPLGVPAQPGDPEAAPGNPWANAEPGNPVTTPPSAAETAPPQPDYTKLDPPEPAASAAPAASPSPAGP